MVEHPDETGAGGNRASPDIYEARVVDRFEQLDTLLRSVPLDVGCSHPHFDQNADGTVSLLIYSTLAQVEQLRGEGYTVELGENVSQRADRLKAEIGTGDRFEGGRIAPKGFGEKPGGAGLR